MRRCATSAWHRFDPQAAALTTLEMYLLLHFSRGRNFCSFVSFDTIHAAPTSCCLRYSIGCNDCKTCATLCNTQENAHQPDARTYAVAPPAAAAATVRYQRRSSRQPQACRADDDGMGRYACGEATGAQIWHGSQHICIACTVLSMTRALMLCATIPAWS